FDGVLDGVAGADVVDDLLAGRLDQRGLGEQGGDEVARDELAVAVDEEAAVGVAVPRDPDVGAGLDDLRDDVGAVLLDQWIGLVVREAAVDLEAPPRSPAGKMIEELRRNQAVHADAGIEHNNERLDDRRVEEA